MALNNFRSVNLKIDKANDYFISKQFAKEGDYNGRKLVVQLTNGGLIQDQAGVALNLGWKHQKVGNKGLDPFVVVDAAQGIFEIAYPIEMMQTGNVLAVIQIIESDKIVGTRNFTVEVEASPIDEGSIVSENSFTVLQDALLKTNDWHVRFDKVEADYIAEAERVESQYPVQLTEVTAQLEQTINSINARGYSVSDFGAKGDLSIDDGNAIQQTIDFVYSLGGGDVLLLKDHLINTEVVIPSNVVIKSGTSTRIKSTTIKDGDPVFRIQKSSNNVGLEGNIAFDYENKNSNIAISIEENVSGLALNGITFKNFYSDIQTIEQNVIRIKTGVQGTISNLIFKNISILGDGVVANGGGAGRCIKTTSYGVSDLQNFSLNISNVHFENCYNVDVLGNPVIEDFDPICFQHGKNVNGYINVNNITAKNINKRLVKIQGAGVNISNVVVDSNLEIPWLFAVLGGYDVNIDNVIARGNIIRIIEVQDSKNVSISKVNVSSDYHQIQHAYTLFSIINSSGVNISDVNGFGCGGFSIYGEKSEDIYVTRVSLKLTSFIIYIQDRNISNTPFVDGYIRNVNFSDCKFDVLTTDNEFVLFDVDGRGNHPIEALTMNNIKVTINPNYRFAGLRFKNINDLIINNMVVDNKYSGSNSQTLLVISNVQKAQIRQITTKGIEPYRDIHLQGATNVLLERSTVRGVFVDGAGVDVELNKIDTIVNYENGASESQVTIS